MPGTEAAPKFRANEQINIIHLSDVETRYTNSNRVSCNYQMSMVVHFRVLFTTYSGLRFDTTSILKSNGK